MPGGSGGSQTSAHAAWQRWLTDECTCRAAAVAHRKSAHAARAAVAHRGVHMPQRQRWLTDRRQAERRRRAPRATESHACRSLARLEPSRESNRFRAARARRWRNIAQQRGNEREVRVRESTP